MRRREALQLTGATLALAGCDHVTSRAARLLDPTPPAPPLDPRGQRLLRRATFGAHPRDAARLVALGEEAWLEEQLRPEGIDDAPCDLRTRFVDAWHMPRDLAFELRPEHVERQLAAVLLLRAIYSRRQLKEVVASFWSDHFHVAIAKDDCRHLTLPYVRDAIRPHALGDFTAMLRAVTLSPAMLTYLDGRESTRQAPNENHARELLELHTLGVDGGYEQKDVMEAARCLTGWTVREKWAPGTVGFDPERHDDGEKHVLGQRIPAGGGRHDVDRLLAILVAHPSCSGFIARKLARFFIDDEPPANLVARTERAFRSEGIRGALRTLLHADARGSKLMRPFRFVAASIRAIDADVPRPIALLDHLTAMGHAPFRHPTPDGYPHEAAPWLGTLMGRWRFAHALSHGQVPGTHVALGSDPRAIVERVLGRPPTEVESRATAGTDPKLAAAIALASPAFQEVA